MSNDMRMYPVVSSYANWKCPECGSDHLRVSYSVVEYRDMKSPILVLPGGQLGANHEAGEMGDVYESNYTDEYTIQCVDCGTEVYELFPATDGSVGKMVTCPEMLNGVDVKVLPDEEGNFLFATCDSDGTMKKWKNTWNSTSPACIIVEGKAVWSNPDPEGKDQGVVFAQLPPAVAEIVPSNMYHQVLWVPKYWDAEAIGYMQQYIDDLEPLPFNEDWWLVRKVNHTLVY